LLVGLPGAGKTTVGSLVARRLSAEFIDVDEMIEREQGVTIREIFSQRGEAAFRTLERDAMERAVTGTPSVLAPGGGWASQQGAMEAALPRCLIVYLRTEPEEAARRVGRGHRRPLLAGADPVARLRELLDAREEFYQRAEVSVDTDDRTPEQVAVDVVQLARSRAGW
jgi:shikimate kinase